MSRKYHIFISSTHDDLKNERLALCRIIFELGHIPICMDPFDITDKNGWRTIKKNIGECDYFLALTAHRYGLLPDGSGSAEIEYAQALKMEIPVLALVIAGKARWKGTKKEVDPKLIAALDEFKEKLRTHPHAEWTTMQDLKQNARELLTQEMFLNPRGGWAPGIERAGPDVANALGRLVAENEDLKRQVVIQGGDERQWQKKMRHTLELLAANKITLSFFYAPGENWENTIRCRYLRLFKLLVPELYLGKTTSELSRFLGSILNPDLTRSVRRDYPTPSNTIKKIMTDLNLLKLVHYTSGGSEEVWELTEYGKELYTLYRLRQFEHGVSAAPVQKEGSLPEGTPQPKAVVQSDEALPPPAERFSGDAAFPAGVYLS
ncbi:hypothetical protein FACS189473_0870 [Spirochaetia bacterium]|nr:hypothetical protein FACS189473_0870 [Spirochaetia bacterium]